MRGRREIAGFNYIFLSSISDNLPITVRINGPVILHKRPPAFWGGLHPHTRPTLPPTPPPPPCPPPPPLGPPVLGLRSRQSQYALLQYTQNTSQHLLDCLLDLLDSSYSTPVPVRFRLASHPRRCLPLLHDDRSTATTITTTATVLTI